MDEVRYTASLPNCKSSITVCSCFNLIPTVVQEQEICPDVSRSTKELALATSLASSFSEKSMGIGTRKYQKVSMLCSAHAL